MRGYEDFKGEICGLKEEDGVVIAGLADLYVLPVFSCHHQSITFTVPHDSPDPIHAFSLESYVTTTQSVLRDTVIRKGYESTFS